MPPLYAPPFGLPLPPLVLRIVRVSHCFQARVARRRASGRINARETAHARESPVSDLEAKDGIRIDVPADNAATLVSSNHVE